MLIYIAHTDKAVALDLASKLEALGYKTAHSWTDAPATAGEPAEEAQKHAEAQKSAQEIRGADLTVMFSSQQAPAVPADLNAETDAAHPAPAVNPAAHNGNLDKHVETGLALTKHQVALIGQRESVFHSLTNVFVFADEPSFLAWLQKTNPVQK